MAKLKIKPQAVRINKSRLIRENGHPIVEDQTQLLIPADQERQRKFKEIQDLIAQAEAIDEPYATPPPGPKYILSFFNEHETQTMVFEVSQFEYPEDEEYEVLEPKLAKKLRDLLDDVLSEGHTERSDLVAV